MKRRKVRIPQRQRELFTLCEQQVAYLEVHGAAMGYPADFITRYRAGVALRKGPAL